MHQEMRGAGWFSVAGHVLCPRVTRLTEEQSLAAGSLEAQSLEVTYVTWSTLAAGQEGLLSLRVFSLTNTNTDAAK